MKFRNVLPWAVAVVAVAAGFAAAINAGTDDWVLFDLPRGGWLASVRSDAPVVVLEEREGWRKVRIEGWVAAAANAAPAPAAAGIAPPATAAASPGPATSTLATVEGIAPPLPAGATGAGTRLVLLVGGIADLDRRHRELGAECLPPIEAGAADLKRLEAEMGKALNSSDNFRQAAEAKDRARAALSRAEREQQGRVDACRVRAEDLFQQHAAARGFVDTAGRFRFADVKPGDYRVIVLDSGGDLSRAAALECRVDAPGPVVLDPGAHRSDMQPFWGLR